MAARRWYRAGLHHAGVFPLLALGETGLAQGRAGVAGLQLQCRWWWLLAGPGGVRAGPGAHPGLWHVNERLGAQPAPLLQRAWSATSSPACSRSCWRHRARRRSWAPPWPYTRGPVPRRAAGVPGVGWPGPPFLLIGFCARAGLPAAGSPARGWRPSGSSSHSRCTPPRPGCCSCWLPCARADAGGGRWPRSRAGAGGLGSGPAHAAVVRRLARRRRAGVAGRGLAAGQPVSPAEPRPPTNATPSGIAPVAFSEQALAATCARRPGGLRQHDRRLASAARPTRRRYSRDDGFPRGDGRRQRRVAAGLATTRRRSGDHRLPGQRHQAVGVPLYVVYRAQRRRRPDPAGDRHPGLVVADALAQAAGADGAPAPCCWWPLVAAIAGASASLFFEPGSPSAWPAPRPASASGRRPQGQGRSAAGRGDRRRTRPHHAGHDRARPDGRRSHCPPPGPGGPRWSTCGPPGAPCLKAKCRSCRLGPQTGVQWHAAVGIALDDDTAVGFPAGACDPVHPLVDTPGPPTPACAWAIRPACCRIPCWSRRTGACSTTRSVRSTMPPTSPPGPRRKSHRSNARLKFGGFGKIRRTGQHPGLRDTAHPFGTTESDGAAAAPAWPQPQPARHPRAGGLWPRDPRRHRRRPDCAAPRRPGTGWKACNRMPSKVLVERVQAARSDGTAFILVNPAAFTHTSVALRRPRRGRHPVHRTPTCPTRTPANPSATTAIFSDKAVGVVCGFGADSYRYALDAALARLTARTRGTLMDLRKIKKPIDLLGRIQPGRNRDHRRRESVRLARVPKARMVAGAGGGPPRRAPPAAPAMPMQSRSSRHRRR